MAARRGRRNTVPPLPPSLAVERGEDMVECVWRVWNGCREVQAGRRVPASGGERGLRGLGRCEEERRRRESPAGVIGSSATPC
jgi:hypothetical protein